MTSRLVLVASLLLVSHATAQMSCSAPLVPFYSGPRRCGYKDPQGHIAIKPHFGTCFSFSEGLAVVEEPSIWWGFEDVFDITRGVSTWGFIDTTGRYILKFSPRTIRPEFALQRRFSEGFFVFRDAKSKRFGYIDRSGHVAITPQFDWASPFSEGYAAVAVGQGRARKSGFIRHDGSWFVKPQFGSARPFRDGMAIVTLNHKWGYIDASGKLAIKPRFDFERDFSDGLAAVSVRRVSSVLVNGRQFGSVTQQWGYINKEGTLLIPFRYATAANFSEGLAAVAEEVLPRTGPRLGGALYGYISKAGVMVIKPQFGLAEEFHDQLAAAAVAMHSSSDVFRCGYIDQTGQFAILAQYTMCQSFEHGLAPVERLGQRQCINKSGQPVRTW